MTLALLFWLLMILWLIFGLSSHFGAVTGPFVLLGNSLLLFILFLLLGIKVFGSPLQG